MDEREREALSLIREYAQQARGWAREGRRDWTADAKTVAAVAHLLGQIGEMTRRVSAPTKRAHADVPWRQMAGLRDRLYHDYERIDLAILAETVARDLPDLVARMAIVLRAATDEG
jgi:uncharacterized protein with HEPN domain